MSPTRAPASSVSEREETEVTGRIGNHLFRCELPDIFFFRIAGDVHGPDVEGWLREMRQFARGKEHIFTLTDASRVGSVSPDARRLAAQPFSDRLRGMAVYGASFAHRVITLLISKAFVLLSKSPPTPLAVCETEEQARAWIREQREALARSSPASLR